MSVLIDIKTGDPESAAARFQLAGYAVAYGASSGDCLDFDAEQHIYRLKATGDIVPGVTEILRATDVSLDFDELRDMSSRIGQGIDLKRDIGTALHHDAHAFDDDDLDWSTVNEEVKPYLDAWVAFRQNHRHLHPATRERLVYSPAYRYAGTLDGIFLKANEGEIAAAVITERWSVQLTPGKRVPYRITPYKDFYQDAQIWKSIVTTYWAQAARRRAA